MAAPPPEPPSPLGSWHTPGGNRWPRQETVELLRIRSEMDAVFMDAAHKAPLWDEVSRKLGELGYNRSGRKCKEKFENVQKYCKRTKQGPNSRADGKNYHFFDQLKVIHAGTMAPAAPPSAPASIPDDAAILAPPISTMPTPGTSQLLDNAALATGVSFSSENWSSSSESEEEDKEDRKRKRDSSERPGHGTKTMAFFEGLLNQVIQRQEAMQQAFLEAIDKREEDRRVREEAWRGQETARLAREHAMLAHERAAAATRDAAVLGFLQKLTGQAIQLPPPPPIVTNTHTPPPIVANTYTPLPIVANTDTPPPVVANTHALLSAAMPPPKPAPQHAQLQQCSSAHQTPMQHSPPSGLELVPQSPAPAAFSRWPKVEINELIRIRSNLEHKYQEGGPKGPLWEEISAEMERMGYNRNPKKCKEKWENINKYFKKVKENSKIRPVDAKTCPYFHQLDALYRQRQRSNTPAAITGGGHIGDTEIALLSAPAPAQETNHSHPIRNLHEIAAAAKNDNLNGGNGEGSGACGGGSGTLMKPEDILKDMLMKAAKEKGVMQDSKKFEKLKSHEVEEDNDDDSDEEEDIRKMQYKVQFQRPN